MADSRALTDEVLASLLALTGPRPRVLMAFSGGLDSTVLAHLLAARRRQLGGLRLVHIDHGLQPSSRDWSAHCAAQARAWRLPCQTLRANIVIQPGDSVEAVARDARYGLLARELRADEVLVTAQHRDDQAETLLLQLLRGAGLAGLAAMPPVARFGANLIARPLLAYSRAQLEHYARAQQLRWIDDPTNRQERFDRNFLRQRILPALRQRWPGAENCIARSAQHLAAAQDLLMAQAEADLRSAADGEGLSVVVLRRLSVPRRAQALRTFILRAGLQPPSTAQIREMAGPLLSSRADAQPEVRWSAGVMARRSGRVQLRAAPAGSQKGETSQKSWRWRVDRVRHLSDGARLELIDDPSGPIDLDKLPATLQLRFRQGGETVRPGPRARTQSLKKLLQAAKLTVEQRARMPLLLASGATRQVLAAGDRWLDASVMANVKSRRRARLVWEKRTDQLSQRDE